MKKMFWSLSIAIVILFLVFPAAYSLGVDSKKSDLPAKISEGTEINTEIEISDFQYGSVKYISIKTDLEKLDNEPIFNIPELDTPEELVVSVGEKSLEIERPRDLNTIKIKIRGKAPPSAETFNCCNIKITKFKEDKTLRYYEVNLLNENKTIVPGHNTDLSTFEFIIKDVADFRDKLKKINDEKVMEYLGGLFFEKGLIDEANKFADIYLSIGPREGDVPYYYVIVPVLLIFVAFIVGRKLGHEQGYDEALDETYSGKI